MLPGKSYDIASLTQILRRRKWLLLLPLVAGGVGAYVFARQLPDQFRSETTILVVPQQVPEIYVRPTVTTRIEDRLRTITQQTLSRTRLEQIVGEFDLYPEERKNLPMEDVVELMRDEVELEVTRSDSFRLAFVYRDPEIAMKVTNRLATLFVEENVKDREVLAESANKFLEAQLDDARTRLLEQEKRIENYRLQHSGELPSQLQTNLQIIQSTQQQIQALLEAVSRDRDRHSAVERAIADLSIGGPRTDPTPSTSPADPAPERSATLQHEAAVARLAELETRLTPAHPDVIRMRRQVAALAEKAAAEQAAESTRVAGDTPPPRTTAPVSAAERARLSQLATLRAERDALSRQIAQRLKEEEELRSVLSGYQARVERVPTREAEMISLTRDYDTVQSSYRALLAKKEDSQIAANLERQQSGEQFRVIDPARVPEAPFSPKRPLIQVLGLVVGLVLGLGITALLEIKDRTLRTGAEVLQVLNLPILAVVPVVEPQPAGRWWRRGSRAS